MSLHRAIILTTDKKTLAWKTIESKRLAIEGVLNSMKNADFTLDIKYSDFTPEVVKGRITRESFDSISLPLLKAGYDFVLIHVSEKQWIKWGIQPSLRGAAQRDTDEIAEAYFSADEHSKRDGFDRFVEVCLHELSHLFCHGAKRLDETHAYHEANGTIVGLFLKYNMENYQRDRFLLKKELTRLQKLWASLTSAVKPKLYPITKELWLKPTQAYGVANDSWYPKTGHHIGTDFATPVGTPIKAHNDGAITNSGYQPASIGYWCEVSYKDYYLVFCHLKAQPTLKTVLAGDIIGYTGDTGFIKGVHLHVEGWHEPMDRSKLTKNTWNKLTFNVIKRI